MLRETGDVIHAVLTRCPGTPVVIDPPIDEPPPSGGAVVFFPSYSFMHAIVAEWRTAGVLGRIEQLKPVFTEPQNAAESDSVMRNYCRAARSSRGAVLLAVVGAKMSEGINFGDELARLAVVVGVPYAQLRDPVLREKQRFVELHYGAEAARTAYENAAMRAVNQAIGRAIRHRHDYAAVLLLDGRYGNIAGGGGRANGKLGLPGWMRGAVSVHAGCESVLGGLTSFFHGR